MAGIHRRRRKRETTTDDYAKMMARMLRAYGNRIGQDPAAGLSHLRDLEAELANAVNVGIYTANKIGGRSVNQLADDLGVSKQAVHKRVLAGERVEMDRVRREIRATMRTARPRELPPGSTGN